MSSVSQLSNHEMDNARDTVSWAMTVERPWTTLFTSTFGRTWIEPRKFVSTSTSPSLQPSIVDYRTDHHWLWCHVTLYAYRIQRESTWTFHLFSTLFGRHQQVVSNAVRFLDATSNPNHCNLFITHRPRMR